MMRGFSLRAIHFRLWGYARLGMLNAAWSVHTYAAIPEQNPIHT